MIRYSVFTGVSFGRGPPKRGTKFGRRRWVQIIPLVAMERNTVTMEYLRVPVLTRKIDILHDYC